jgi:hypothetical protein
LDYRGVAAVILAASIGLTLVIGAAAVGFWGRAMSEVGGQAMIAIGGAIVGALAGYVTGRTTHSNGEGDRK